MADGSSQMDNTTLDLLLTINLQEKENGYFLIMVTNAKVFIHKQKRRLKRMVLMYLSKFMNYLGRLT